jgi:hypothetical protein
LQKVLLEQDTGLSATLALLELNRTSPENQIMVEYQMKMIENY